MERNHKTAHMAVLSPAVTPAAYQGSPIELFIGVEHWEPWTSHTWQLPTTLGTKQPLLYVQAWIQAIFH